MRGRFLATATSMILAVGVSLAAQAKPDFSGKWVMDPPPAAAGDGGAAASAAVVVVAVSSRDSAPSSR